MRGGYSETITFETAPNGVVTLPASVTFNSYTTPVSANTANITINQPTAYFANTNFTRVAVNVSNNQVVLSLPASLGYDQVECGSISLNPALTMSSTNDAINSALPAVTFSTTPGNTTGDFRSFNWTGVSSGAASITAVPPSGSQQTNPYSSILRVN